MVQGSEKGTTQKNIIKGETRKDIPIIHPYDVTFKYFYLYLHIISV